MIFSNNSFAVFKSLKNFSFEKFVNIYIFVFVFILENIFVVVCKLRRIMIQSIMERDIKK